MTNEEAQAAVAETQAKLAELKRSVQSAIEDEETHSRSVKARILRVCGANDASEGAPERGDKAEAAPAGGGGSIGHAGLSGTVDDLMIDFMLREGREDAARALAVGCGQDPELTVSPSHRELRMLLATLDARDTAPALEWCTTHRVRLRKLGSTLEGLLHLRSFAVLATSASPHVAVAYARAHFPPLSGEYPQLVRQAMGALALSPSKRASHPFFDEARWADVRDELREKHRALLLVPATPPLVFTIAAALTVLRTPKCRVALTGPLTNANGELAHADSPAATAPPPAPSAAAEEAGGAEAAAHAPTRLERGTLAPLMSAWRSLASTVEAHTAAAAAAAAAGAVTGTGGTVGLPSAGGVDAPPAGMPPPPNLPMPPSLPPPLPALQADPPAAAALPTSALVPAAALVPAGDVDAILANGQGHMAAAVRAAAEQAAYGEQHVTECPVCTPPFSRIAARLPTVQRSLTTIVCRLSGELMHEDNPATVLPDGNVYSYRALKERCNGSGRFAHPITGEVLELDQMRRAFFL